MTKPETARFQNSGKPRRGRYFLALTLLLTVVIVAGTAWGFHVLNGPFRTIRELNSRYQRVQRGMSVEEVRQIMGQEPDWHQEAMGAWWDHAALPSAEAARIRRAARYTVLTFSLPVTFEFTFDENGRVVGRHSYD